MDNVALELGEINLQRQNSGAGLRRAGRSRQDSAIDLWNVVDRSRLEQDVHIIPLNDLYQRFRTDPQRGLTSEGAASARAEHGDNKITPPKPPNYFWLLFKELFLGFNSILWVAGVLAFLAYKPFGGPNPGVTNLGLGIVLVLVVICNSILNVYQEMKSIKIVASFSKLLPTIATVRRDGREQQVVVDELVPGDIILIRMGDKLPADCRFLKVEGIKVSSSRLVCDSDFDRSLGQHIGIDG